jgi:hypothetical protein
MGLKGTSACALIMLAFAFEQAHGERAPRKHPHSERRSKLDSLHTFIDIRALPRRGIAVRVSGLGGDSEIIIDADTSTIRERRRCHGLTSSSCQSAQKKTSDTTRTLSAAQLEKLMKLADAAWREEPTGPMSEATDIREDLIVVDNDEFFFLSGFPISVFGGAKTGRPAASDALRAIYASMR